MNHGSLFSGIGGFDLAAEWMGWNNVFHCEWNEFGQKVLKHYWPEAISLGDIHNAKFKRDERGNVWVRRDGIVADTASIGFCGNSSREQSLATTFGTQNGMECETEKDWLNIGPIDIISGGFPCQPFSMAGKRKGTDDPRHLWPQMLRVIREIKPTYIVGENVGGILNWNGGMVFEQVCADLEAEAYEVQPFVLPACGKDAPHRRDRVWFVARRDGANSENYGLERYGRYSSISEIKGNERTICVDEGDIVPTSTHSRLFGSQVGRIDTMGSEQLRQERDAADTTGEQSQRVRPEQREPCESKQGESRGGSSKMGNRDATYTMRTRRWQNNRQRESKFFDQNGEIPEWRNFPTQPPVRGRNDGIPSGLVGITVSKHRNESIKAYGNAIVPQVAYEIFKAIHRTHRLTTAGINDQPT